jgi:4,5-dihydroxyphthalate decarboxylase
MYGRVFEEPGIDVGEVSIGRLVGMRIRNENEFVALPYYFGRKFPLSSLYVRQDFAGGASDIAGLRVGLAEYDHTAHIWTRALLEDVFGLAPAAVRWVVARREATNKPITHRIEPPPEVFIDYAPPDKYLARMLLDGDIDVLINPRPPSCFDEAPDRVRRLVTDYEYVEQEYYRRTGNCPIQHVLGVRRELLRQDPAIAEVLVNLFRRTVGDTRTIWNGADDVVRLFGLGEAERASLTSFLGHFQKQGLSSRTLSLDEFFES